MRFGGATLIQGFPFGPGGDHCDLAFAVRSSGNHSDPGLGAHFDPEVAVRVWPGPLSLSRSGRDHFDPGCCSGLAETTVLYSLQLRSGGDDFDPEVAVRAPVAAEVGRRKEEEEKVGQLPYRI